MDHLSDTTHLLIQAAKRVFAERGYDGATVKEIAEAAGVNVSLVSYHFGGKEGLYRTCLEKFGRGRVESAERVLQAPTSAEEFRVRLAMFLDEFIEHHLSEPEIASILHRDCTAMDDTIIQDIFAKHFMKMFEKLIGFFADAKKAGILRSDVDPLITTGILFGGFVHILRTEPLGRKHFGVSIADKDFRKRMIDHALKNLTEGVLHRGAT